MSYLDPGARVLPCTSSRLGITFIKGQGCLCASVDRQVLYGSPNASALLQIYYTHLQFPYCSVLPNWVVMGYFILCTIFQEIQTKNKDQGMFSLSAWFGSGKSPSCLADSPHLAEFPWLAYQVLNIESEREDESQMWPQLHQSLFLQPDLGVDKALQVWSLQGWY